MKVLFLVCSIVFSVANAQHVKQDLQNRINEVMSKPGAKSASIGMYVEDHLGNTVFALNEQQGFTTASTQKLLTAAAALDMLGADFTWMTTASYTGSIEGGILHGNIILRSNGDPTLGSWRYPGFKPDEVMNSLSQALKNKGITSINGQLYVDDSAFDFQTVPGGWPWNDMGNYYGAGVWGLNWRENQFDAFFDKGVLTGTNVHLPDLKWVNNLKVGGNSDQSIIYTAPHSNVALINGTLPNRKITVSGAMPNPPITFASELIASLNSQGIKIKKGAHSFSQNLVTRDSFSKEPENVIWEWKSPPLREVVYFFLSKSVNLYGETLVKTIGKERTGEGSFERGVKTIKDFWSKKSISSSELNFIDGSGLSPQNYVSPRAQVKVLQYALKQPWSSDFTKGFPTQNGMKMKSGTLGNVKSFAGYHTSKSGQKYTFSIILNNYQAPDLSASLFKVLDGLK